MGKPSKEHSNATKLLPRYLRGLCGNGLVYYVDSTNHYLVKGFCDFDYVVDLDKRRLLTGYVFIFCGNVIRWKSCLQYIVTFFTSEVEYVSLTKVIKEPSWLKGFTK